MRLSEEQRNRIKEVAEKYKLSLVLLFGSAVTGKSHPQSDVDIAAKTSGSEISFKETADLQFELQEIFPGREVDLAIINHADPFFLKKIVESALLLFGSLQNFAELKTYAFKRYIDHQKYFQMEKKFVEKFLTERVKETA